MILTYEESPPADDADGLAGGLAGGLTFCCV